MEKLMDIRAGDLFSSGASCLQDAVPGRFRAPAGRFSTVQLTIRAGRRKAAVGGFDRGCPISKRSPARKDPVLESFPNQLSTNGFLMNRSIAWAWRRKKTNKKSADFVLDSRRGVIKFSTEVKRFSKFNRLFLLFKKGG